MGVVVPVRLGRARVILLRTNALRRLLQGRLVLAPYGRRAKLIKVLSFLDLVFREHNVVGCLLVTEAAVLIVARSVRDERSAVPTQAIHCTKRTGAVSPTA